MAATRQLVSPPAVEINVRRIVAVGTGIWFVAFVVLLPLYGWLGHHDHHSWLWICLAGWVLGLIGLVIMRRHRAQGRTV